MPEPGRRYRILLVDDSPVVRRVLTDVITSDPQLEVAGTASNGRIGLERIEQLKPDLVILDIEMPELDGLGTIKEIRKKSRRLPVIMFSTLTHRGASITLDALTLGADDYVPKASNSLGLAAAIEDMKQALLPKIHALCSRRQGSATSSAPQTRTPARQPFTLAPKGPEKRIDALVIGVSTGGPDALCKVLSDLPANLPVPIAIVQHMPPIFTKLLAERLSAKCPIPVKEVAGGEAFLPGTIWLAQGGHHSKIVQRGAGHFLELDDSPPRNFCRPSVDVLFESAVSIFRSGLLGVILTGMGSDGLHGCDLIRQNGGQIVIQDEETSVVWGMPGAVAKAGIADSIKPLTGVSDEIVRRILQYRFGNLFSRTPAPARSNDVNPRG
jgi:two-component system chemotaxis response regulator CheB